jgi:four helix bundle protein
MKSYKTLHVYRYAVDFNVQVINLIQQQRELPFSHRDQLSRASLSIALNIAEGMGRNTPKDQSHFLTISRGSTYECMALIEILTHAQMISSTQSARWTAQLESISKILYTLIQKRQPLPPSIPK